MTEEIPFTTERKYMATRIDNTLYIKGAPEIVMGMCSSAEESSLLLEWQQRGLRTLALAHAEGQATPVLDALVAIADPVRQDVPAAVQECLTAGIDVKIVTGDTPATAAEIARQIGLMNDCQAQPSRIAHHPSLILTGPQVAAMSDDELRACAKDIVIIARARPMDKQRLVQALQACGEVVAVTGDGTNDAPALHAAHVGLSMGDGTAVAKEASDITIIDNSFASIGRAVMWGRSLYRNIQRFILFQMTVNVCACLTVLAGSFMGTDAPLTVTQMLWVNLIMDTFAAMALSSLPPDRRVMTVKPRDPGSHIISRKMLKHMLLAGSFFFLFLTGFWQFLWHGDISSVKELLSFSEVKEYFVDFLDFTMHTQHLTPYESGVFFSTFVMMQFWNLFNIRYYETGRSLLADIAGIVTRKRKVSDCFSGGFLLIAAVILFGQILIVNLAGDFFEVAPLSAQDWLWTLLTTSLVLIVPDLVRTVIKLTRRSAVA